MDPPNAVFSEGISVFFVKRTHRHFGQLHGEIATHTEIGLALAAFFRSPVRM
jgi:hypothetical protein